MVGMTLLLGGILLVSALILVCLVLLLLNLRAILQGAATFSTSAKEGEPSQLQAYMDHMASRLAERITARFTGVQGGVRKREKAVEGAVALDVLQMAAPPWLNTLLEAMPNLKKKIEKNPAIAAQAMQMFAGGPAGGNNEKETAAEPFDNF